MHWTIETHWKLILHWITIWNLLKKAKLNSILAINLFNKITDHFQTFSISKVFGGKKRDLMCVGHWKGFQYSSWSICQKYTFISRYLSNWPASFFLQKYLRHLEVFASLYFFSPSIISMWKVLLPTNACNQRFRDIHLTWHSRKYGSNSCGKSHWQPMPAIRDVHSAFIS